MSAEDVESPKSMSLDESGPHIGSGKQSSRRGQKKQPLTDELLSLLESGPGQGGAAPVSGKRHIERLNYKKLHDVSVFSKCIMVSMIIPPALVAFYNIVVWYLFLLPKFPSMLGCFELENMILFSLRRGNN